MSKKILTLLLGFFSFLALNAADGGKVPGQTNNKKDELNGVVTDAETKKPIEGVTITAILLTKKEKVAATDDEGGYAFDGLRPGTYKFVFEKAGYKKITKEKIIIKSDDGVQLNIEMIELSDFDILPSPISLGGGF